MTALSEQSRSSLLHSVAELVGTADRPDGTAGDGDIGPVERFLERYYRHVAAEDLVRRSAQDLLELAMSHRELAAQRPIGRAQVRLLRPTGKRGWAAGRTVVEIVTDDMPFLVDSVGAELTSRDRSVALLIHPQLVVRRDAAGALLEVLDRDAPERGAAIEPTASEFGTAVESWIHIEIGGSDEKDDELLRADLERILSDVREVVEDWSKMRDTCEQVARQMVDAPPSSVPGNVVTRTTELLQWLAANHFTFLGYREYTLSNDGTQDVLRATPGTGLGLLRSDPPQSREADRLTPEARATAREPQLLIMTKANSRSTVHRRVYLDYVGIKTFDADGAVTGERRFLGLLTSAVYSESVRRIPVVRERVRKVLARAGYTPDSHSGKDLIEVLESYPRDELFQTSSDHLYDVATTVLHLQERRTSRLFLRRDEYGRFMSAMMYIPRDRYTTAVRLRMQSILQQAFDASSVDYTTRVSESALAQLHFVVRVPRGKQIRQIDEEALQHALVKAARTWDEDLVEAARAEYGDEGAAAVSRHGRSFSAAYKADFSPRQGVADLRNLDGLQEGQTRLTLYREPGSEDRERRFKLFRRERVFLTDVLPVFTHLGVEVVDERPYEIGLPGDGQAHVYDFGLRAASAGLWTGDRQDGMREIFQDAFAAAWSGRAESDGLNALVLGAGLTWRQVVVLRAITRYLRQIGSTFSQAYLGGALVANPRLARRLVRLFEQRFDPAFEGTADDRTAAQEATVAEVLEGLEQVASLDQDRIVRTYLGVVQAALRTSFYQRDEQGGYLPRLSLKLDCAAVPGLPSPKPMFEIWVYSPRVEGVHLRFGKVARGGLRWSDRREDFRTEVLGLVKAQLVKNAVIVPTGSKGGFFPKTLPDAAVDRDAWLAEGTAAYTLFISGLLDITDNLVASAVVPPKDVVRYDGDDTYLVVAADKGTATFSDIANGVAQSYGYWLDDAFASGGSAGYDHKAMGITARGAWESVKRHFREMDVDTQTQEFTVVGIGDMSGDVFGNGMLLSEHIRLVAAFDHRHVFIDPTPVAASSYTERRRLFDLPRSSWAEYDTSLISAGGGVWPRSAKSVPVSEQVCAALALPDGTTSLTPAELMRAILLAPVDLLWNGGIGTYVKASAETDAQIGDRANDAIRVDGNALRVKVIGEGGNLGLSQLGRIEAAMSGVRVNTDAIDNSAGVDTSDHEVNLKIPLTSLVRDGELELEQRNTLLASMTDEVAVKVLRDNYEQNVLLGTARAQEHAMLPVHQRLIHWLEERGGLDRSIEFLPSDAELARRGAAGKGLTSPEFSVLVAYAKLALKADLTPTSLPDESWFEGTLAKYFPEPVRSRYRPLLHQHPLRREIITNSVVNSIVNRGGTTFVFRAAEETGASSEQVTRAFVVSRSIFGLTSFVRAVEDLDGVVPTGTQTELYLEFRRLMDRSVRWFLHNRPATLDVAAEVERFRPAMRTIGPLMPDLLQGGERERLQRQIKALCEKGIPEDLSQRAAALLDAYSLLDIVELATDLAVDPREVAEVYYSTSERFGIDALLIHVSGLPRDDRWDALARGALRDDLYLVLESLTRAVLDTSLSKDSARERIEHWCTVNADALSRARTSLSSISLMDEPGISALSVALRTLRGLVRSGAVAG